MCDCKEEIKELLKTIKNLSEKIDELEDHAKTICCGTNCSDKVYTDMMHKCYHCFELFCDDCIISDCYCPKCKKQNYKCDSCKDNIFCSLYCKNLK